MKKRFRFEVGTKLLIATQILFLALACTPTQPKEQYYTEADFGKLKKIDIHCHINTKRTSFMEQAIQDNFRILTINTYAPIGVSIEEQQELANFQRHAFPNDLAYLTTFSMESWNIANWQTETLDYLKESFKKGAIGIKVWKDIGMVEKNKDSSFVMIDNPKFDPVFDYLEENGIPVCGHLGEPKNCWLPIDSMTVNNDKRYFKNHPEYHMYLHPECPSYMDQINARDHLLKKHPNLKFIGAHLGSMEWSVDLMSEHFDRFPNLTIDMAARTCHLQAQAQKDWQKVHDFFIKYQDRILYGTDEGDYEGSETDSLKLRENVHAIWLRDWKFLTSGDKTTSWEVDGEFKGLHLPKKVIDKIFYLNAERLFPEFKKMRY